MRKFPWVLVIVYFILTPFLLSFAGLYVFSLDKFATPILSILFSSVGLFLGIRYGKQVEEKAFLKSYLPVYIPVLMVSLTAAVLMIVSKGFFGHDSWAVFVFMFFPFLFNSFMSALSGQFINTFAAPFLYYSFFLLAFFLSERRSSNRATLNKPIIGAAMAAILVLLSISGITLWERSKHVLPSYGFDYGNGYSSVDLQPYDVANKNHRLPELNERPSFIVEKREDMPILDGAEAAYPVYAAFANATYKGINEQNILDNGMEIVAFTNTIYAFERLVTGEIDIFFGAQPSQAQKELAEQNGKELVLTPIGKEAFVFFVNKKNPVDNLTTGQIKSIYSGKTTNWSKVGGEDVSIRAFQRPADSGSQTIMEKIMGDTPLMDPLKEEIAGMGDVIEEVAHYRNYNNSIGYSFRFFTTGMNPNEKIQLLSVDGIEPSAENIANGTYPYIVNLYAISVKDNPKKTIKPMLDWMQGPQGQKLVEEIGYIPL
ncbi:substrate-binding domain-containing protein [Bacillus sp. REN3]|uniref:PstS family phosphate ABC transporter substrate-binding protein n=1 Tax=Bacillus sp. REN3 TaxID=2802440 RepID=UPI001AEDE9C9|nr:substrate-binding domain-containing protein [Bacillus sp. REN3]